MAGKKGHLQNLHVFLTDSGATRPEEIPIVRSVLDVHVINSSHVKGVGTDHLPLSVKGRGGIKNPCTPG